MIKVAIPTRNKIHHQTVWALLRLQKLYDVDCSIGKNTESVAYNRNLLVRAFLEGDCTHLLFIDDDVVPPSNVDLERLMLLNKDVIALPCPVNMFHEHGSNYRWNIFNEEAEMTEFMGSGVKEVYAAGTGCMLIRRGVLEKLDAPFTFIRNKEDGVDMGEDYLFCKKVRDAGFEIWVDWTSPCGHYKDTDLLEFL